MDTLHLLPTTNDGLRLTMAGMVMMLLLIMMLQDDGNAIRYLSSIGFGIGIGVGVALGMKFWILGGLDLNLG